MVNHLRFSQKWMVPSWLEAGAVAPLCWGLSYVTCTCCCLQRDAKGEWRTFQLGDFFFILSPAHSKYHHTAFHGNKSNSKRGSNRYTIPCNCCWIPTGSHVVCGTYPSFAFLLGIASVVSERRRIQQGSPTNRQLRQLMGQLFSSHC